MYLGWDLQSSAEIPSHWNIKGEIDGYVSKWVGIFLFPGINLLMLLLMVYFPKISVKYKQHKKDFDLILPRLLFILVLFFSLIHIYTLLLAKHLLPPDSRFIMFAIGLMFILIGNILPKIPSNFYAGIRTPWTLSSESVWRKTHRIGGLSFVFSGLLMILIPLFTGRSEYGYILTFVLLIVMIIYLILYSFLIFKKEENSTK
jgi:uncharacterized membrane protein